MFRKALWSFWHFNGKNSEQISFLCHVKLIRYMRSILFSIWLYSMEILSKGQKNHGACVCLLPSKIQAPSRHWNKKKLENRTIFIRFFISFLCLGALLNCWVGWNKFCPFVWRVEGNSLDFKEIFCRLNCWSGALLSQNWFKCIFVFTEVFSFWILQSTSHCTHC